MMDDVDRILDSPIADSVSSSGIGTCNTGVSKASPEAYGLRRTCAQCSAGRIPPGDAGPGDGDFVGDFAAAGLEGPDIAGVGDFGADVSGALSVMLGGCAGSAISSVKIGYSGVVELVFESSFRETKRTEDAGLGLRTGRTPETAKQVRKRQFTM